MLTQLKFSCSARLPRTAPAPSTTGRSCAAPPAPLATRRGQRSSCATGAGSAGCWHGHNHGRLHSYVILTKILTIIYINSFVQPSLNSIPWACLTAPPPLSNHTAFFKTYSLISNIHFVVPNIFFQVILTGCLLQFQDVQVHSEKSFRKFGKSSFLPSHATDKSTSNFFSFVCFSSTCLLLIL